DENRALHGLRPVAVELAFGFSWSDLDAVPLPLPDGREVRFRGKADRVDRGDDGRIHIVDYKTGSRKKYADITEDDPPPGGRRSPPTPTWPSLSRVWRPRRKPSGRSTVSDPARPPAPDQIERDRIRDDLDATLFVEAGAGSGKTSALVTRVVALVVSGAATLD